MNEEFIEVKLAAKLTGEHERTLYRKIDKGEYKSKVVSGAGRGGKNILIQVNSLPAHAQVKYLETKLIDNNGMEEAVATQFDVDMAAYKERFGEQGLKNFIIKYELVQDAFDIEMGAARNKTELWKALAERHGISKRTLDRMVSGFKLNGSKALMKKIDNKSKGVRTSICYKAKDFIMSKYIDKVQRTKQKVFDMLIDYAETSSTGICHDCIYCEGTKVRTDFQANNDIEVPVCHEKKEGLIISDNSATISRILKEDVDTEVLDYVRRGRKYWEAKYMQKATREKPKLINECWFGDHHVFDAFIKDTDGKIVKPWLTAWFDAASGCIVGWCLSTNPNSKTIAEAFAYGVSEKKDFPFCGVPSMVYTDNGRDYRSHAFEGYKIIEKNLGKALAFNVETDGILKQLNVSNTHAKAYHGWAKPIERFFGTLADRHVRELPGWCGRHPDERWEGFDKELKKMADRDELLTMEELKEWFINVLNEYHHTDHSGYNNQKPIDIYMNGEKSRYDIPSWSVLSLLKMDTEDRKVYPEGIKYNKGMYWHPELRHLAQKVVKIKYNKENPDVILVIHDSKFVCAATLKETMKMINEDSKKIEEHMANQHRQEHEVKERIAELSGKPKPKARKVSKSNMVTGEVIDTTDGNVTSLEHKKAMKAYENEVDKKKNKKNAEEGSVDKLFRKTGEEVLKRAVN